MKKLSILFLSFYTLNSFAQFTGTNTAIHEQEKTQKQIESNRQEINNATQTQNTPSTPTKVDVSTWGINSKIQYEITNHLFGPSIIVEKDQTLKGIKLTGLFNLAYYQSEIKDARTGKKKGRFVLGFEFPTYTIANRFEVYTGLGGTLGDRGGLYLDAGVDTILTEWFKIQTGLNWNSKYKAFAPQISAGLVW